MLYEGKSLDEQINNLLDDLEEFYKTELDIDLKKFKNGRYIVSEVEKVELSGVPCITFKSRAARPTAEGLLKKKRK